MQMLLSKSDSFNSLWDRVNLLMVLQLTFSNQQTVVEIISYLDLYSILQLSATCNAMRWILQLPEVELSILRSKIKMYQQIQQSLYYLPKWKQEEEQNELREEEQQNKSNKDTIKNYIAFKFKFKNKDQKKQLIPRQKKMNDDLKQKKLPLKLKKIDETRKNLNCLYQINAQVLMRKKNNLQIINKWKKLSKKYPKKLTQSYHEVLKKKNQNQHQKISHKNNHYNQISVRSVKFIHKNENIERPVINIFPSFQFINLFNNLSKK